MSRLGLKEGSIYRTPWGLAEYSGRWSNGKAVMHEPGSPDMQSCFIISPGNIGEEVCGDCMGTGLVGDPDEGELACPHCHGEGR